MYKIASIGGDGIGPEIISAGKTVLDAAGEKFGFDIEWTDYDIGAERYLATGDLITEEELAELRGYRAIYFGAIGDERVTPGILEKGILLAMRFAFDQYINLRPVRMLAGTQTPLADKGPEDIDFVVVRENTEDFYVGIGSRFTGGHEKKELEVIRDLYHVRFGLDVTTDAEEIAYQIGIITREASARVMDYAFSLAMTRDKKVSSVDKANVLSDVYGLWRDVFTETAAGYPEVTTEFSFVDAVTMWFVKNPEWFDVIVTTNMFGDIITDLGAITQGGMGIAAGGNINPEGVSMFEPIGGSAPKYTGLNVINPLAAIACGGMMLEQLGETQAAQAIENAIMDVTAGKIKDLGAGRMGFSTNEVGDLVAERV